MLVAYAALVLLTHHELLGVAGERLTLGGDARTSYWQDVAFAVESLRAGELPLWNPFERGGYPYAADPQPAVWSPLSWVVYLFGLVSGGHGIWLQELRQLAAPALAAAGFHWFLRRRGLGHAAAGLAGSILVAGAFAQRTITMATYWPWAFLGFVLVAVDAVVERPSEARTRRMALALLLLATAGFPPTIFYALLIACPYALLRLARAQRRRAVFASMAVAATIAGVAAVAIVVPLAEQTALSWRAERGLDYVLSNPAPLAHLATLLDPAAAGKQLFVGLVGLLMAGLALIELGGRRRRSEVIFWATITIAGALLAAADEVPLLGLLAEHVPGFGLFRIASRYTILTHTGLAVLAAYGLDRALASLPRGAPRRAVVALASICLMVQVYDLGRLDVRGRFAAPPDLAAGEALAARVGERRVYNEWSLGPRGGAIFSVRDWRGRSKDPMSFARYQEVEAAVARGPALLRHFAVEHLLVGGRREVAGRPRIRRPSRVPGVVAEGPGLYRFAAPGPEVYWTREVIVTAAGEGLAALSRRTPGTVAIVDEGELGGEVLATITAAPEPAGSEGSAATSRPGAVVRRGRNHLTLEVDAPGPGLVVSAEVWHPGWRAWIDGVEVEVHRVNHLLRGVAVDAGVHRVEFAYRPRSLPWVAGLYALAWAAILVGDPRRLVRRVRRA
ncbi:MAG: hypothetical protein KC486_27590 [Myxococcales bacterium]|nr:hypothetical protein [Myxococcales bacterium]